MQTLTAIPSPAKLNLFLNITGRRSDGYHELQTLFQLIDYGDTLSYSLRKDEKITLEPTLKNVATTDNLIYRAAQALQQYSDSSLGVDIQLTKRLPMGGGIGGGSSNAATTLLALNQLWGCQLNLDQLAKIGLGLGADVPIFVHGCSAFAEGIGEQLYPVKIPEQWYLIIKPACEVATVKIFSHKLLTRDTNPITIAAVFDQQGHNDCETVVRSLYPEVDNAINWLNQHTPAYLTGTGACIYGIFADQSAAEHTMEQLPANMTGFVAKGVNQSPTHLALNI